MSAEREPLLSIFAAQREALMRFLRLRLGNAALAEDLTQETWLRAAGAGGIAIGNPRGYLFRIAANLALDHQRRAAQGIEVTAAEPILAAIADPAPSPEAVALHRDALARLQRAIEGLSPRCRQVFVLSRFEGLTYNEVAGRLGISRNTVVTHMAHALAVIEGAMAAENFPPGT